MTAPCLLTAILALSAAASSAYDRQFFQPAPSSWIIAVPSSETAQLTRSSNSGGDVARYLRIQPSSGGSDSGSPPTWFRQSQEGAGGGGAGGAWSQKWRQGQDDGRSKSTSAYGGQLPSWKQQSSQQGASRRTNSGPDDDDGDYVAPQRRNKDQRISEPVYGDDGDDGGSRKPKPPRPGPLSPPPPGPRHHGPPSGPRHHGPPPPGPRRGPGPRAGPPPPPPPPHHRRPRPPPPREE